MINILWVEDEFSEQKQVEWFNHRNVCVKTNFLSAKDAIDNTLAQFDVAVLDINLENTEHSAEIKQLAEHFKITEQAFLEESGMNLFLRLLENGFPKEQIVFLTANADNNISLVAELRKVFEQADYDRFDSILAEIQLGLGQEQINKCAELINAENLAELFEYLESYYKELSRDETKNTYNRFCEAYKRCRIDSPEAINKNLKESKHSLNTWLKKHEDNAYLVLRRGIIEGCEFLKSHIEKNEHNIQLRDFIKLENKQPTIEIVTTDIKNYLNTLSQFLPLKQPMEQAINVQYRLLLRTLAHEWEENIEPNSLKEKYAGDLSKIRDIYTFAWLMKMTRNWVSHANLLEPLNHQTIAFLFMVNMRAMFKLPKATQAYEEILLSCISPLPADNLQNLDKDIKYTENCIDGILNGLGVNETGHFGNKINAIYRQNTGNPDAEEHDFKQFLLQYFWVNQKFYLKNLTADSNDFLPKLARHIYNRSFS